jgi:hypothetical protein
MSDAKLIGVQRLTGQHAVAHADPFVVFTDPQNESDVVVATIARMDRLAACGKRRVSLSSPFGRAES